MPQSSPSSFPANSIHSSNSSNSSTFSSTPTPSYFNTPTPTTISMFASAPVSYTFPSPFTTSNASEEPLPTLQPLLTSILDPIPSAFSLNTSLSSSSSSITSSSNATHFFSSLKKELIFETPNFPTTPPHAKPNRKSFMNTLERSPLDDELMNHSFTQFLQQTEKIFTSLSQLAPFTMHSNPFPIEPSSTLLNLPITPPQDDIPSLSPLLKKLNATFSDLQNAPLPNDLGLPSPKLSPLPRFPSCFFSSSSSTRLPKCNSSNTFFAEARACHGTLNAVLKLVAIYIYDNLQSNSLEESSIITTSILDVRLHPLLRTPLHDQDTLPSCESIFNFLFKLFDSAKLYSEISIFMLIYVDRLLLNTQLKLTPNNWLRMVVGGLLLSCKVWDDDSVWNADFCTVFHKADVKDMNELEHFFLNSIFFNANIDMRFFTKFYLKLHDFAIRIPLFSFTEFKSSLAKPTTFSFEPFFYDDIDPSCTPDSYFKPKPNPSPAYLPGVTPAPLTRFIPKIRRISSAPFFFTSENEKLNQTITIRD